MHNTRTPHLRTFAILTPALSLILVATSCGGGGGGDKSPTSPNPTDNNIASVSISGNSTTVNVGESITLAATARNAAGNSISGTTFAWSSGNTSFATVGATTGVVTGVAVGNVNITAAAGGFTGSRTISVVTPTQQGPPPNQVQVDMPGTAFEPNNFRLAVGGTVTFVFTALAHDVNFGGANAPAQIGVTANASVTRQFPVAGTYTITCSLHAGMNGTITVQ